MKMNKMDLLIKMLESGGDSYKKAKDMMNISVKYEFVLASDSAKKF